VAAGHIQFPPGKIHFHGKPFFTMTKTNAARNPGGAGNYTIFITKSC